MFLSEKDREKLADAGAIYEDMNKASERSVNGYPCFFSAKFMHKDDVPILVKKIKACEEALKGASK